MQLSQDMTGNFVNQHVQKYSRGLSETKKNLKDKSNSLVDTYIIIIKAGDKPVSQFILKIMVSCLVFGQIQ